MIDRYVTYLRESTGLSYSELGKIGAYKRRLKEAKKVPTPEPRWPKCSCGTFLAMGCCPNCS
jgi:hypothetical protein